MGWLAPALLALLIVSLLAVAVPGLFGPAAGAFAPLLAVVAVIGLGGVWWRHSHHRVDAEVTDEAGDDVDEPRGVDEGVVET